MTTKQIELIKAVIDRHLVIRGINVTTKLQLQERKNGEQFLELSSTYFQTFPVIHQNLSITNFGGSIKQDNENENLTNIYIPVHVRYDGNGVDLFDLVVSLRHDIDYDIFVREINHKA